MNKREKIGSKNTTHGLSKHPLYSVWGNIKRRCYDKNLISYPNYGGRGVLVCDEWRNDFKAFYDWCITNGWTEELEVDKDYIPSILGIENNIYSPEMCMLLTVKENSNKRKNNRVIEFNGQTKTAAQWADELDIPRGVIIARLNRGLIPESILDKKISNVAERSRKKIECATTGVEYESGVEASAKTGCPRWMISEMCKNNKTFIPYIFFKYKTSLNGSSN